MDFQIEAIITGFNDDLPGGYEARLDGGAGGQESSSFYQG
jgi:hypothetical protein